MSIENPLISIIIPVYNVEQYLKQCLDSVINQTYKNFEIICINDASTDKSLKILQEYEKKYDFFKLYNQEKNKGVGVTWNLGINYALGKYISFVDSDDYIEPNLIEEVTKTIKENNNIDIIKFKGSAFDSITGKQIEYPYIGMKKIPQNLFNKKISFEDVVNKNLRIPVNVWLGLYRKDFIKSNNIKFNDVKCGVDVSFSFLALAKAKSIYLLDKTLINYRKTRQDSITNSKREANFACEISNFLTIKKEANLLPLKHKKYLLRRVLLSHVFFWFMTFLYTTYGKQNYKLLQKTLKDISLEKLDIKFNFLHNNEMSYYWCMLSSIKHLPFYMFPFTLRFYNFYSRLRRFIRIRERLLRIKKQTYKIIIKN